MSSKSKKKRTSRKAGKTVSTAPNLAIPVLRDETAALTGSADAWPATSDSFETHHLLDLCRTKWQYGAWKDLTALSPEEIALDADRAKVMLLVAVAHSHEGDLALARQSARQAMAWGCNRTLVARLLISASVNSLARVAAALGDEAAGPLFHDAIGLVEGRADVSLLARTRQVRETARLGLLPEAVALVGADIEEARAAPADNLARLQALDGEVALLRDAIEEGRRSGIARRELPAQTAPTDEAATRPRRLLFSAPALARYQGPDLDRSLLYIDSKSLPRAGLHFLRNRLDEILGPAFSFCEQYHEPGCCGMAPCVSPPALTEGRLTVRLIKSHDFALADPAFDLAPAMRRLVLVRDPLYILTSWWSLHTLSLHEARLTEAGIAPDRLFFRHERPMLAQAYDLVAAGESIASTAALEKFLATSPGYIARFLAKWADPARHDPRTTVSPYEGVQGLMIDWLQPFRDRLAPAAAGRLDALAADPGRFRPRADPFSGPNEAYSAHLRSHRQLFEEAAARIREADRTGWAERLAEGRSGSERQIH